MVGWCFLLSQLVCWPFRRWGDLGWLLAAITIYVVLRLPLVKYWQCALFVAFVWLNLWLVFRSGRIRNARLVFLDMTACFLVSMALMPAYGFPDIGAAAIDAGILIVLIVAYFFAWRAGLFARPRSEPTAHLV
jgi:hypothetical protein